ncbi:alpha/beta hydrolase-fold protein [Microbispora corallina]|uniref:Esterase n=1 Tax=Microbispora corallina TaxID=83302 RepID=A0ABQ4FUZ8_9ACTN|nr:alpha/beta hydrolase-fold protein [Microbispora corallina]GIH38601.1 esterase [Microbispora corallina]
MSLLGVPLLVGTIVLTIAVTAASVWLGGRLRGSASSQAVRRAALALACQVCAVLTVAVVVNDQFEFYATWDDLVGSDSAAGSFASLTPQDQHGFRTAAGLTFAPYGEDGVRVVHFTGPRTHIGADVYVWLPPQYGLPAYRHTRFPAIELLPGYPGPVHNWFTMLDVTGLLRHEMARGEAEPAILVAPTMEVVPGLDTDCTDIPGGPAVETWAAEDVRDMVTANFRARMDGAGWAAMGYSEGGFCAVKLAVQHPRQYTAAVSLSGYFTPTAPAVTRSPGLLRANDLLQVLTRSRPPVSLLVMGTRQDADTAADVTRLRAVVHAPTTVASSVLPSGGHNYGVWGTMLPPALRWVSHELSDPRRARS